jgi:RNA polymerase sigma-70 factor (ECF subfamily)
VRQDFFQTATPRAGADVADLRASGTDVGQALEDECDFDGLVDRYYLPLYRFALSLTREESDACDLTQQTFYAWARKGYQLMDRSKVKSWLFTTLYREYLQARRKTCRYASVNLDEAEHELPPVTPTLPSGLDGQTILEALSHLDLAFQAPVALFYLEDYSYPEIGRILNIPLGTVKSRISRGLRQLQAELSEQTVAQT